jgi:hypothetical protein
MRNNNGSFSQYYENMRLIEPGDLVFSYAGGEIRALGVAVSSAYEAPKPDEFGAAGAVWAHLGWRVQVDFRELSPDSRLRPKTFIDELLPHLPTKYSPLDARGNSLTAYLFEVPDALAQALLVRTDTVFYSGLVLEYLADDSHLRHAGEDRLEAFLRLAPIDETQKRALIDARRGQGRFRQGVSLVEPACRFTGVTTPQLLVASHIRPWHRCESNEQRLDPFNGLMLTPTYDRLFDRGLVTFAPDHSLWISPQLAREDVQKIHMDPQLRLEPFRPQQQEHLAYHREHVFRAA